VITGRIRDRLAQHYGDDSVFMDIDNIPFGTDFRKNIAEALAKNELLLAVIGPDWLGAAPSGRSRIHDEDDPVRIEVETALQRGIPTIPVLVGGAGMPKADDLPDSLKSLSFHNAAEVDSGRDFHAHMDRLIRSMEAALKGKWWRRFAWRPFGGRGLSRRQAGIGLAGVIALVAAVSFTLLTRDSGPIFIGNITYIENQYQQFAGAPPSVEVRQHIVQAIELAGKQQYDRALEAFGKVPADLRVPAVWNDLGVVFERLNDLANARAAYQAALARDPAFAQAKANLARLEIAAASVAAAAAPARSANAANDINLLAPEEGGQLLSAPNEAWRRIASGKEDEWVETRTGADADADVVYAFKDKKLARFHKLTVLISGSNDFNPKEIDILAGDEGPNGSFRSVGKCTLTNRLLFETRYQECELPPTTARFVKLKFMASYHFNAWARVSQVRLIGRLAP